MLWLILYVIGGIVAVYWLAIDILFVIGLATDRKEVGSMRYVSGETIILPREPEPERPRKRWRVAVERR